MLAILALLGIGLAVGALGSFGGDDDSAQPEAPEQTLGDDDDTVIGEAYRGGAISYLDDLVAEGELTRAEVDESLADTLFPAGSVNIDAGAGNDNILGSNANDTLSGGVGDDFVTGGEGNDRVLLGDGDDVSGIDFRSIDLPDDFKRFPVSSGLVASEAQFEGGNDTIVGGTGNDSISDSFGSNLINGQQGDDFLISVDQDGLTPDTVLGGHGDDILVVDQGDTVTTSLGADLVTVDVFAGVTEGYQVVTITDFNPAEDTVELEGETRLLFAPTPDGPQDVVQNPISVTDLDDDSGAVISVGGVPVVVVIGGQGMTVDNVRLST